MKHKCISSEKKLNLIKEINFIKAISDETRLHILSYLKNQERCVCEITSFLGLPQNLVSHHLKVLWEYGLVEKRKDGLKVFYKNNHSFIKNNIKLLEKLIK